MARGGKPLANLRMGTAPYVPSAGSPWDCDTCGRKGNRHFWRWCAGCGEHKKASQIVGAGTGNSAVQHVPQRSMGKWANGPPPNHNLSEVEALRKEVAALKGQLGSQSTPAAAVAPEEEGHSTKCSKLAGQISALTDMLGEHHPEVVQRKEALEALRSQRPLGTRLLASQKKIEKLVQRQEQKAKEVAAIKLQQQELATQLATLETELASLSVEVEALKKQQAKLVEEPGSGSPAGCANDNIQAARATISDLLVAPGMDPNLMGALRSVLGLLPAPSAAHAAQHAPEAAPSTSAPGQEGRPAGEGTCPTVVVDDCMDVDAGAVLDPQQFQAFADLCQAAGSLPEDWQSNPNFKKRAVAAIKGECPGASPKLRKLG